jgi:hypothetical protein
MKGQPAADLAREQLWSNAKLLLRHAQNLSQKSVAEVPLAIIEWFSPDPRLVPSLLEHAASNAHDKRYRAVALANLAKWEAEEGRWPQAIALNRRSLSIQSTGYNAVNGFFWELFLGLSPSKLSVGELIRGGHSISHVSEAVGNLGYRTGASQELMARAHNELGRLSVSLERRALSARKW